MHRFSYFQGTAINAGISAIDIALWDIKGRALDVPIYELLGGACRTKARVYCHIYEKTIDKVLEECQRKKDAGFTAFGHINPFLDEGVDEVYFKTPIRKMLAAIDNVEKMRAVVGNGVDLLIELHRRLTPAEAVTFCNAIAHTHSLFVEDPIRPGSEEGPVAAIAEAHNVQVVQHNHFSPIGLAACQQLAAAIPNLSVQDYATGFEASVFYSTAQHLGSDVVDHVPQVQDGFMDIPSITRLAVAVLENATEIRPALVQPMTMRPHKDARFIVDQ